MEGNTALGASSPAKPAFTRPEPLSQTRAVVSSSSHMSADSGDTRDGEFKNRRHASQQKYLVLVRLRSGAVRKTTIKRMNAPIVTNQDAGL